MEPIHLLVDARNAVYRCAYGASSADDALVKFIRHIGEWMEGLKATTCTLMWDAPRKTLWRNAVMEGYKNRKESEYVAAMRPIIAEATVLMTGAAAHLGVRQLAVDCMEADDLIYAAVSALHPAKTVVVSTDSDMAQLAFRFDSCRIYDHKKGLIGRSSVNPAIVKSLAGDLADTIKGYKGIGPVKARKAAEAGSSGIMKVTADDNGTLFSKNMAVIDLSMCPHVHSNVMRVMAEMSKPAKLDAGSFVKFVTSNKLSKAYDSVQQLIAPFRKLT